MHSLETTHRFELDTIRRGAARGLLSMPSCSQESKANVYYDLACVYARLSKEVDCQRMLQISFQLRPINQFFRDWLSRDPDLERMREKAWFQALLEEEVNGL